MKKFIIIILFIILILGTVGKFVFQNYDKLKEYYKYYNQKILIEKKYKETDNKLKKLKILVEKNKTAIKVDNKIVNFCKKRYLFRYNDYQALNILSIDRVKDQISKNYFYKVHLQFTVNQSGTLFAVLNMYYQDPNIKKIFLVDKRNIYIYIKEKSVLSQIGA